MQLLIQPNNNEYLLVYYKPEYMSVFEAKLSIKIQHPDAKEKDNLFLNLKAESVLPSIRIISNDLKDNIIELGKVRLNTQTRSLISILNTGCINATLRVQYQLPQDMTIVCDEQITLEPNESSDINIEFSPKQLQ